MAHAFARVLRQPDHELTASDDDQPISTSVGCSNRSGHAPTASYSKGSSMADASCAPGCLPFTERLDLPRRAPLARVLGGRGGCALPGQRAFGKIRRAAMKRPSAAQPAAGKRA